MTTSSNKPLKFGYDPAGRPPIIEAAGMTLQAYKDGQPCIGHDLPPRMGKSTLIQILAIELQAAGAPFVHALTPWTNLAKQLINADKVQANLDRVKADGYAGPFLGQQVLAIDSARFWKRKSQPPYTLLTSTIHLANFNSRNLSSAIALALEETSNRPVLIVDEVHLVAEGQRWSDVLLEFQAAGAFVITMTGTAKRSDDASILGFREEPASDWEARRQKVVTRRGDPYIRDADGLLVRKVEGTERSSEQREKNTVATGLTVPWDESFTNGWMHLVSSQPQTFRVTVDGEPMWINEVARQTADKNKSRWMRSAECCRQLAEKGIEALSRWRSDSRTKQCKILAVTTSDIGVTSEKEANVHAREMRRQLKSAISNDPLLLGQDLNVEICTSLDDRGEPDENAAEKLRRFGLTKTDEDGNEPIDILIVKGMGLVGLDVPECKILLDSSSYRCGPVKRQLATRPLTVWKLSDGDLAPEAQIFYPQDPANHDFYESLTLTAEAGKETKVVSETPFIDEQEVKDPELPVDLIAGTGTAAGYLDEFGKWVSGDHDRLIAKIHKTWPETIQLRRITLIGMYQDGAFPDARMENEEVNEKAAPKKREVRDLSKELQKEKEDSFGSKARQYASQIYDYKSSPEKWRAAVKTLQSKAKKKCHISPDEPVDRIQDPEVLKKLKKALDQAVVDYMHEVRS
jgi:hypothetical protein